MGYNDIMNFTGSNPVLAAHDLAAGAEVLKPPTNEPWRRRAMGDRAPEGQRIILAEAI